MTVIQLTADLTYTNYNTLVWLHFSMLTGLNPKKKRWRTWRQSSSYRLGPVPALADGRYRTDLYIWGVLQHGLPWRDLSLGDWEISLCGVLSTDASHLPLVLHLQSNNSAVHLVSKTLHQIFIQKLNNPLMEFCLFSEHVPASFSFSSLFYSGWRRGHLVLCSALPQERLLHSTIRGGKSKVRKDL